MLKKFNDFIKESYNSLDLIKARTNFYSINESQESASQHAAIKLLIDKLGWDKEKANTFIRKDLRDKITPLKDKQIGKFTLGITRMYINGEFNLDDDDATIRSNLNATLELLSDHLNEYDRNLNGLTSTELISKFENIRENIIEKEKREIKKLKLDVSDYEIIKIDSYNDAKKYYEYTNPHSRWCITYMENMYDNYTCNGINQIYFCLKNGFETIKPKVDIDAPLDEYGLSMLSIIVNENGELAYCTSRWNHDNGGSDKVLKNGVEISKVVNVDFYEVFKPNTLWKDAMDKVNQKLANGESLKDVFDVVEDFSEGYAVVTLQERTNFIDKNGKFISNKWYDDAQSFKEGHAVVRIKGEFNFIDINGNLLSDKWFYDADSFNNGYALVCETDENSGYNEDGEYDADYLDFLFNYINANGEYLFKDWLSYFNRIDNTNYTYIEKPKYTTNYNCNIMNDKYKLLSDELSDEWFFHIKIADIEKGYIEVKTFDDLKTWKTINLKEINF